MSISTPKSKTSPRPERLPMRKSCTDARPPPRAAAKQASRDFMTPDAKQQDSGTRDAPRTSMSPSPSRRPGIVGRSGSPQASPPRPERSAAAGSPASRYRSPHAVKASPLKTPKNGAGSERFGSKDTPSEEFRKIGRSATLGYPVRTPVSEQKRRSPAVSPAASSPVVVARELEESNETRRTPSKTITADQPVRTPSRGSLLNSMTLLQQEVEARLSLDWSSEAEGTQSQNTPRMAESALAKSQSLIEAMKEMGLGDDIDVLGLGQLAPLEVSGQTAPLEVSGTGSGSPRSPPSFVRTVDTSEVPTALLKVLGEMWMELKELRAKQETQELRSKLENPDARHMSASALHHCTSASSTIMPTSASSGASGSTCMTPMPMTPLPSGRCFSPVASPESKSRCLVPDHYSPWLANRVVRQNSGSVRTSQSQSWCPPSLSPLRSPPPPQHSMPAVTASPITAASPLARGRTGSAAICRPPEGRASLVSQTVTISSLYRIH